MPKSPRKLPETLPDTPVKGKAEDDVDLRLPALISGSNVAGKPVVKRRNMTIEERRFLEMQMPTFFSIENRKHKSKQIVQFKDAMAEEYVRRFRDKLPQDESAKRLKKVCIHAVYR